MFIHFVGQENAKLALILNAIEQSCGGVILIGKNGTGKSTLVRAFKKIALCISIPFIELPINATEEAILGGIDIEATIKEGKRVFQHGILSKANKGFLYIEDINLFPQDILSLIFEVQSRRENIVEREGIKLKEPAEFVILATMNPEEAEFSNHFLDRFGMCVIFDEIKDKNKRKEIIKLNLTETHNKRSKESDYLIKKIIKSRDLIKKIKVSDEIKNYIAEMILKEAVQGHRADIFLLYAASAYAAYLEEKFVTKEHVNRVAPLVLLHRKKIIEQKAEQYDHEHKPSQDFQDYENENKNEQTQSFSNVDNSSDGQFRNTPSVKKEEVFPVGEAFKVKRFIFRKDRFLREIVGKRTKTKTKGRGGRYVRSLIKKRQDIAIDATIRAAAPYQKIRGRTEILIVKNEDLRYKEKERKMRHIVIFVVDGSGSMGVEQRMIATKGAILSLLMDCYQKRDKVSMILFRKDRAEVVLPPTSSVELALKRLKEIPTGGKTPLSSGLMETYKLIRRIILKEPQNRFLVLLITDGKANVSITGRHLFEEIQNICLMLREISSADFAVIDTEKKDRFMKMDIAFKIAEWLQAKYFLMDDLKSETIFGIVSTYKNFASP